ncbi:MAG: CYTH domain-containing protein [Clostridia bacterium]|nr:CYTH domain-containing protein [Clostridia bacterium]
MPEIEIKLTHPDPGVLMAAFRDPAIAVGSAEQTIRMRSEYYDTADEILFAARCGLRFRAENERGVVTLKTQSAPSDASGLSVRGEFEVEADSLSEALPKICALAPAYAELLRKAAPDLKMTAAVTFTRIERHAVFGETEIAFSVDTGVFNNDPAKPFAEFEAELKRGSAEEMRTICADLAKTYGLIPLADSKLKRALACRSR